MTIAQAPWTPPPHSCGGIPQSYPWSYQGQTIRVVYETLGSGTPVLLLPAFSTVSTRTEWAGIAQILAPQGQGIAVDWVGFGDSDRPPLRYGRSLYQQFLHDFVRDCVQTPVAIVAAGHAAGYAMQFAYNQPDACSRLILIAPTWKGPLRAMGIPVPVATGMQNLVRMPLLGQILYGLNTHPAFLKWMYQRHVYVNTDRLTPDFIAQKHQITQRSGARFAPAAFVTGGLDPMDDREEWLHLGRSLSQPVHLICPTQAPPQSTAEMTALAALPSIQSRLLPGTLGLHEEYAAEVGAIVLEYLQG